MAINRIAVASTLCLALWGTAMRPVEAVRSLPTETLGGGRRIRLGPRRANEVRLLPTLVARAVELDSRGNIVVHPGLRLVAPPPSQRSGEPAADANRGDVAPTSRPSFWQWTPETGSAGFIRNGQVILVPSYHVADFRENTLRPLFGTLLEAASASVGPTTGRRTPSKAAIARRIQRETEILAIQARVVESFLRAEFESIPGPSWRKATTKAKLVVQSLLAGLFDVYTMPGTFPAHTTTATRTFDKIDRQTKLMALTIPDSPGVATALRALIEAGPHNASNNPHFKRIVEAHAARGHDGSQAWRDLAQYVVGLPNAPDPD